MSFKMMIRFLGVLCLIALTVGFPELVFKTSVWFYHNLVLMFVAQAAEAMIVVYLAYLVARYMIVQYRGKFFS